APKSEKDKLKGEGKITSSLEDTLTTPNSSPFNPTFKDVKFIDEHYEFG
ncbi:hypothetical protein A2U01_0089228, partial [Trifolium medium]|nr:hypothetical protein [Trifolium medium]